VPGARCKACLLDACFSKYILDPKKHPKIFSNGTSPAQIPTNNNTENVETAENLHASTQLPSTQANGTKTKKARIPEVKLTINVDSLLAKPKKSKANKIVPKAKASQSLLSKREHIKLEEENTTELITQNIPQVVFTPSAKKRKKNASSSLLPSMRKMLGHELE